MVDELYGGERRGRECARITSAAEGEWHPASGGVNPHTIYRGRAEGQAKGDWRLVEGAWGRRKSSQVSTTLWKPARSGNFARFIDAEKDIK
jgi:hypothetical protein